MSQYLKECSGKKQNLEDDSPVNYKNFNLFMIIDKNRILQEICLRFLTENSHCK